MARHRSGPDTSPLAMRLGAAGHVVVACAECGRALAADLDHSGAPFRGRRRYCSTRPCRAAAANTRRRAGRTPAARAARALHGALAHRHALEAAGQLDLTGLPLPDLADLETP